MAKVQQSRATGAKVYDDYRQNFVVMPGRAPALDAFVHQTYAGRQHKKNATRSSNSEDALTWSCFDTLKCLPEAHRASALVEIWAQAFPDKKPPAGWPQMTIEIGKTYGPTAEQTEVDASFEGADLLVFIEAKLFSTMSLADPTAGKPHDQLARKIRVGVQEAQRTDKAFYFLVLDIAPPELLRQLHAGASLAEAQSPPSKRGFANKWLTAYWYARYKGGQSVTPLRKLLADIPGVDPRTVASNMGWLVWSEVYKTILRAVIHTNIA